VDVTPQGPAFPPHNARQFVTGHRFSTVDQATPALGGAVTAQRFEITVPDQGVLP
jgi:hypothetical protein